MPTSKKAADKAAKKTVKEEETLRSTQNDKELSDDELLKQKKEEAKAKKEEAKAEKKVKKAAKKATPQKAQIKKIQKRNPLKIHGKKYRAAAEKLDKLKTYELAEAVKLTKASATTKFDSSMEVHARLGIDPKKSDQIVRSTVALPHGTGKKLRIIAFTGEDKAAAAKKAGAVEAGEKTLVEKIAKGWLDFDVAVATPDMMKQLGKIAKTLGQKGLMPNPKAGTVTDDIAQAIEEINKGKVEFRNDSFGLLHNIFGKVSFDEAKLLENLKVYLAAVSEVKPKGIKGVYIRSLVLTTSMGPSVRVDLKSINN